MTTEEHQQPRQKRASAADSVASSSAAVAAAAAAAAHSRHDSGDLTNAVRGTAESVLNKLEGDLETTMEEADLLQSTEPGPIDKEGRDVEDVLNVISQSIYREAEGTERQKAVKPGVPLPMLD